MAPVLGVGPPELAEGCSGLTRRTHISATSDGLASLLARDPVPPPRVHRLALDSVSHFIDTIRA